MQLAAVADVAHSPKLGALAGTTVRCASLCSDTKPLDLYGLQPVQAVPHVHSSRGDLCSDNGDMLLS